MKTRIGATPTSGLADSAGAAPAAAPPTAADGTGGVHETFELRHRLDPSRRLRLYLAAGPASTDA